MASTSFGRDGVRILFMDGKVRRSMRLGRVTPRIANLVKQHVESMLVARRFGASVEPATAAWLGSIDDVMNGRLAKAGLLIARKHSTLGEYVDQLIASRADIKPSTVVAIKQARNRLIEFIGFSRPLTAITEADGQQWVKWMLNDRKLSRATVGRDIRHCRYFLASAMRDGYISTNPFAGIKAFQQVNPERLQFVPRETVQKLIDACPSAQTKLIVALSRYGGLRCPSEHQALRWGDVNWADGKFWVTSPKTEHHAGRNGRWVPLFPELRPYLDAAFAEADEGQVHVIRDRTPGKNWRTTFLRLLKAAGITAWERLFQNLRASRETELASEYPLHVASAWIGNTAVVAAKHYLQVRDEDFERAAGKVPEVAVAG